MLTISPGRRHSTRLSPSVVRIVTVVTRAGGAAGSSAARPQTTRENVRRPEPIRASATGFLMDSFLHEKRDCSRAFPQSGR
jgi:hypothetical protein